MTPPRLPWARIALLHHLTGFLVAFLVPLFLFEFTLEAFGLGAISGLVITVTAATPPFLGALVAQRFGSRSRSAGADVLAVVAGAVGGALVTALIFAVIFGFANDTPWWLALVVGIASAGGFALQAALAWRRAPREGAEPLN